jgi:hypothetical protein
MLFGFVMVLIPFAILLPIIGWSARRFARHRRQDGAWDERGPKHPTEPPFDFLKPKSGSGLPLEMGSRRWVEKNWHRYVASWWR